MSHGRAPAVFLLALAVAGVMTTQAGVLHLGLRADEYLTQRPWTRAEVSRVFTGSWEPNEGQPDYYRPLTALYQASLFEVFGLNARALHLVSLVELAAVAWLLGLVIWRETRAVEPAALAVIIYLVHPLLPDSTSAWIFHQYHLLSALVVLAALLWWQRCRAIMTVRAWTPVLALAVMGVLLKEDMMMLLPGLLALQAARAWVRRDVPWPSWTVLAAAACVGAALVLTRLLAFPRLYWTVEPSAPIGVALHRMLHAPYYALVRIDGAGWPGWLATCLASGLFVSGLVAAARRPRAPAVWVWLMGALLVAAFAPPLAFPDLATSRAHLITLAAAITLAGGWWAIRPAFVTPAARALAAACLVAGLAGCLLVSWKTRQYLFEPCGAHDIFQDEDVLASAAIPEDIRAWLRDKPEACRSGRYGSLLDTTDTIRWDAGEAGVDAATGRAYHRSGARMVTLVSTRAHGVTFAVRRPDASAARPVDVAISTGGITRHVRLDTPAWTDVNIALASSVGAWLRQSYRLEIRAAPAIPGGTAGVDVATMRVY